MFVPFVTKQNGFQALVSIGSTDSFLEYDWANSRNYAISKIHTKLIGNLNQKMPHKNCCGVTVKKC
jgi:hypothetical protein